MLGRRPARYRYLDAEVARPLERTAGAAPGCRWRKGALKLFSDLSLADAAEPDSAGRAPDAPAF